MFRRRPHWHTRAFKALFFAGILYKTAKLFLKSADKLAAAGAPSSKKKRL